MNVDPAAKLSRIQAYLQGRYPPGFTIEAHVDPDTSSLMFRVRCTSGLRGPLLVLSEEFVEAHWDGIERELDSRDVVGALGKVGQGKVLVTRFEQVILEPERMGYAVLIRHIEFEPATCGDWRVTRWSGRPAPTRQGSAAGACGTRPPLCSNALKVKRPGADTAVHGRV